MTFKVQVVTVTESGEEVVRDVACVERHDLTPASLGLAIADSKAVLQALQEVVVEWQMHTYLQQQRACPHCGKAAPSKGVHHTVFRTVFGDPAGREPPLSPIVPVRRRTTTSFQSPGRRCLPERTTPELLYLETKWAASCPMASP